MADDDKSSSIPWAPLIALLAAGSGIFLFFGPPQSSRPASSGVYEGIGQLGGEDVDARLWQDPLGAVDDAIKHRGGGDPASHEISQLRDRIERFAKCDPAYCKATGTNQTKLVLVPVYIPASPYEEDVENRLRERVAVLDGLEASGYTPEDVAHIGYVNLPHDRILALSPKLHDGTSEKPGESPDSFWARAYIGAGCPSTPEITKILFPVYWESPLNTNPSETTGTNSESILLPYEWWTPKCPGTTLPRQVLVLWVQDGAFRDRPLRRLGELLSWFRPAGGNPGPDVTVIGPETSDTLDSMVAEARNEHVDDLTKARLVSTRIYSCMAEAADSVILGGTTQSCERLLDHEVSLSGTGDPPRFFLRTALTDEALVKGMIDELGRHNIKNWHNSPSDISTTGTDDVAIISEQDTYAARAIQQTFIEQIVNRQFPPGGLSLRDWTLLDQCPCIHPYTYLRGIDGELPKEQSGQSSGDTDNNQSSNQSESGKSNGGSDANKQTQQNGQQTGAPDAEGLNQTDYLERLVDQIVRTNADLQPKGRYIKAVAVLGSDVYDKLEILQALRPKLPGAMFLTNHLDARFSLSQEWNVTRNLFIFSSYGLTLNAEYQRGMPPFRDSFQTAIYEATLEATRAIPEGSGTAASARIFEIGRSGPFDLSSPAPSPEAGPNSHPWIYPDPEEINGFWGKPAIVPIFFLSWKPVLPRWESGLIAAALGIGIIAFAWWVTGCGCGLLDQDELKRDQELQIQTGGATAKEKTRKDRRKHENDFVFRLIRAALVSLVLGGIWCLAIERQTFAGEPFTFKEGISIFPTLIIWHMSFILSLFFMFRAHFDLKRNNREICRQFHLKLVPTCWEQFAAMWKRELDGKPFFSRQGWILLKNGLKDLSRKQLFPAEWRPWPNRGLKNWTWKRLFPPAWPQNHHIIPAGDGHGPRIDMDILWGEYQKRGQIRYRLLRVIPMAIVYFVVVSMLVGIIGTTPPTYPRWKDPWAPSHGAFFPWIVLTHAFIPMLMTFFVVDATMLHEEFVRRCRKAPTKWPDSTYKQWPSAECNKVKGLAKMIDVDNLSSYLDIQLIAERTEAVSTLIYYPFIFLFLRILSQIDYFDNLPHSAAGTVIQGLYFTLAFYSAYRLPKAANDYRTETIEDLRLAQTQSLNSEKPEETKKADAIQRVIDEIQNLDQGAFVSLWQQPAIRAIILPSGSIGIWTLLQYLPLH